MLKDECKRRVHVNMQLKVLITNTGLIGQREILVNFGFLLKPPLGPSNQNIAWIVLIGFN